MRWTCTQLFSDTDVFSWWSLTSSKTSWRNHRGEEEMRAKGTGRSPDSPPVSLPSQLHLIFSLSLRLCSCFSIFCSSYRFIFPNSTHPLLKFRGFHHWIFLWHKKSNTHRTYHTAFWIICLSLCQYAAIPCLFQYFSSSGMSLEYSDFSPLPLVGDCRGSPSSR